MFFSSLETVAVMFITLGVGIFACHKGWVTNESKGLLTKVVVNLCIPSIAIINVLERFPRELLSKVWMLILVPFLMELICVIIASIIAAILKLEPKKKSIFINMCSLSNAIFVGMPVCAGIFGQESVPFVMVYFIVNTLYFWGYSAPNIRMAAEGVKQPFVKRIKKMINAPLICCVMAFILLLFDFKLPNIASSVFGFFAHCGTPLSMLLIARIIYENGVKNLRIDKSVVIVVVMRFIISPVAMYFLSVYMGLGHFAAQVYTVLTAMPVMITTAVIVEEYNSDSAYTMNGLLITTFLSLVSIPAYILIMN